MIDEGAMISGTCKNTTIRYHQRSVSLVVILSATSTRTRNKDICKVLQQFGDGILAVL